jgi:hypothetical protein
MPHQNGRVAPRTAAAPIAASTADPPALRIWIAASVACISGVAAAPPEPRATELEADDDSDEAGRRRLMQNTSRTFAKMEALDE